MLSCNRNNGNLCKFFKTMKHENCSARKTFREFKNQNIHNSGILEQI